MRVEIISTKEASLGVQTAPPAGTLFFMLSLSLDTVVNNHLF